ncbi:MAG: glutamate synthase subunit alpha, partial [Chloroflexota bacterium]|nr:glutamate synthase subunit alpha [Chloroflexota bacterium]
MTGLYSSEYEHGSCGTGFVARLSGEPSHSVLAMALESVVNLTHRGAVSADGKSGDGAGVLTQLPLKLLRRELEKRGQKLPADPLDVAVAVLFLPGHDAQARERARAIVGEAVTCRGLNVLAWRDVPVDPSALGESAAATAPYICHLLVSRPKGMRRDAFARAIYLARKEMEAAALRQSVSDFYVPSFSNRTIVYKGLMVAPQLERFYLDLQDPDYETALAVFHQRYSTNTFPSWRLAQPFRHIAHNGEINTLQGNRNWVRAREPEMKSKLWGDEVARLAPIIQPGGSDSANLDNVLEALTLSGRGILHAMAMLIPEAWENMPDLPPQWRAFYEYHACITEPWDGPAAIAFSDGVLVGATLDRNGLRPARYKVTDDGLVCMASEAGV